MLRFVLCTKSQRRDNPSTTSHYCLITTEPDTTLSQQSSPKTVAERTRQVVRKITSIITCTLHTVTILYYITSVLYYAICIVLLYLAYYYLKYIYGTMTSYFISEVDYAH
ncbi:hypothetical protein [Yichang virus]|uniref:Uncharacterized protein n=1 Tax=Yichang virus TaxID=2053026 RepID=A0A2H4NG36_9NIDO|nr:hypothetical protein [Yichang virus]ATV90891.1 hypothetical protein [Yichang virus]